MLSEVPHMSMFSKVTGRAARSAADVLVAGIRGQSRTLTNAKQMSTAAVISHTKAMQEATETQKAFHHQRNIYESVRPIEVRAYNIGDIPIPKDMDSHKCYVRAAYAVALHIGSMYSDYDVATPREVLALSSKRNILTIDCKLATSVADPEAAKKILERNRVVAGGDGCGINGIDHALSPDLLDNITNKSRAAKSKGEAWKSIAMSAMSYGGKDIVHPSVNEFASKVVVHCTSEIKKLPSDKQTYTASLEFVKDMMDNVEGIHPAVSGNVVGVYSKVQACCVDNTEHPHTALEAVISGHAGVALALNGDHPTVEDVARVKGHIAKGEVVSGIKDQCISAVLEQQKAQGKDLDLLDDKEVSKVADKAFTSELSYHTKKYTLENMASIQDRTPDEITASVLRSVNSAERLFTLDAKSRMNSELRKATIVNIKSGPKQVEALRSEREQIHAQAQSKKGMEGMEGIIKDLKEVGVRSGAETVSATMSHKKALDRDASRRMALGGTSDKK
jgi:hypothetical protein